MKFIQCLHILIITLCSFSLLACEPPPSPALCKTYPPLVRDAKGKLVFARHRDPLYRSWDFACTDDNVVPIKQLSSAPQDPVCMSGSQKASKIYSQMLYEEDRSKKPCITFAEQQRILRKQLVFELCHEGVQIVHVGESFRVIIPSDDIFNLDSANFSKDAYITLPKLARWMKTYPAPLVEVGGFSDRECSTALTRRQAEVVMDFLWTCGIDARLAYTVGYDGQHPIACNYKAGVAANRRVELNFHTVPPICELIY